jgi:murein DD-endopeptidase MepM/ murein hydrolase activator NlpD
LKELDLVKNNALECEKSLKRASDRMGSDISGLYERELALKQELAVLYLEKERVEKQIVEDAPAANKDAKIPQTAANAPETSEIKVAGTESQKPPEAAVDISSLAFAWPLKASKSVLSFYGTQKDPKYNVSYFNSGIDITGGYGEEVVASADGKVKYKGEMKSVGKLLIIDHGGNITTLYSHLGVIEVGMGQKIKRGETIGRLTEKSESGAEKPLLHFEIRINGGARDPMDYL